MEKALKTISKIQAAEAMKKAGLEAGSGHAFEFKESGQTGIFVAEKRGLDFWIHGAAGDKSMSLKGDSWNVFEKLAGALNCEHVAFETSRPGLVKIAKKRGYKIEAVILKKIVKNGP